MNQLRTLKVFETFTLFDCIKPPVWIDYLKTFENPPKTLYMEHLFKLCERANLSMNDEHVPKLIEYWKEELAPKELEAADYIFECLTTDLVPDFAAFFSDETISTTQKAQNIYDLIDLWGHVKRIFFQIVFKYSKLTLRSKFNDLDYIVYCQASDALWDFLECIVVVPCGKNNKNRVKRKKMENIWLSWVKDHEERYIDFINYVDTITSKRNIDYGRIGVFVDFILVYIGKKGESFKLVQ